MIKSEKLPEEILTYLATGKREKAAEEHFYSESGISHKLEKYGVEANPAGRPRLRPLTRAAAMGMHVEGFQVAYITKMLAMGEKSYYRILERTRESEPGLHAVGTVIVNPETREVLLHQEKEGNHFVGKYEGDHSCQLTLRGKSETVEECLVRLFQREVFTGAPLRQENWQEYVKPAHKEAVVHVMVSDILVSLYVFEVTKLGLATPKQSLKVKNIRWEEPEAVLSKGSRFRSGAREMIEYYWQNLRNLGRVEAPMFLSQLNEMVVAKYQGKI